jgi:hypothetical protein
MSEIIKNNKIKEKISAILNIVTILIVVIEIFTSNMHFIPNEGKIIMNDILSSLILSTSTVSAYLGINVLNTKNEEELKSISEKKE